MRIKKAFFKNFKNITDIELDLDHRVILFDGDNGNGKSAILEGLSYLLVDDLPEKINEYVRWGSKKFEIGCDFVHKGVDFSYTVEGEKASKKKLIINNKDIFLNSDATKELATYIDPTITKYSAISEQGRSTILLFDKAASRLAKLKEIFGVDKIQSITVQIKEEYDELNKKIDGLNKEIEILQNTKFELFDVPEVEDIFIVKDEYEKLKAEKEKLESLQKLYDRFLDDQKKYIDATNKISDLTEQIILLEDKKNSYDLMHEPSFNIDDYNNAVELLNSLQKEKINFDHAMSKYIDSYNRLTVLIQKEEELNKKLYDLKLSRVKECEFSESDLISISKNISVLEADLIDLNRSLELANSGFCPTCKQEIKINSDDIIFKIGEWKGLIKNELNKYSAIKLAIDEFNSTTNENRIIQVKKDSLNDELNRVKDQIIELEKIEKPIDPRLDRKINEAEKALNEIKEIQKEYNKCKAYNNDVEKQILNVESSISILKSKISDLLLIQDPVAVSKPKEFDYALFKSIEEKIIVHKQKEEERERIVAHNKKIEKDRIQNDVLINDKLAQVETGRREVSILQESRNVLEKEFSSYLIDKGTTFIKEKMNQFFHKTYGKYNISFIQDKNSVDFFYSSGENKITPVTMASGFEKQVISIANRIALCSIQNLGIMILDEIDDAGSADKSVKLFEQLLSEKSINQFFVVTHCDETKEMIKNYMDSKVYYIKNGVLIN